jgi:hypothetical protein
MRQGSKTCTEYLNVAKQWANQLFAAGKPVEDDNLISFVISVLNPLFNTFVTIHSFTIHDREMSFTDFHSELLNHEMLLDNQHEHTLTPESGTFALYTNKPGQSNLIHQNSTNLRKPRYPPRSNSRNQHFAPRNNLAFPARNHPAPNQPAPLMN